MSKRILITSNTQTDTTDITGRDGYIIIKALAYAISTIEILPPVRQESSDRDDMIDLLEALVPDDARRRTIMTGARSHMGLEQFFLNPRHEIDFPGLK